MSVTKGANIVPNKTPRSGIWGEKYDMPKTITSERVCLKCDGKFNSKNKFNRVCDDCKRMKDYSE